ncbi:PAS domain-containing protein [Gramella sp. AN32]|uniref:histidine kinase n=1 Tax=Christiangramia antarctica TaxID=2058158 RepID=A0ABW5X4A9_9FLAO|nr:PAS domain-containing protein [Gramella sp. AN32]MCM4158200.1 hypothetical protein [Gramella sp. AN32]
MKYFSVPVNDIERVGEVDKYDTSTNIKEDDLDFLCAMASEICGTESALITLIGKDTQWIKSSHGIDLEVRQFPREFTFCTHTINNQEGIMVVEDARLDHRFADNPFVNGENPVIFYSGVALLNKEGFPLGTICGIDSQPQKLSAQQIVKLQKVANQVVKSLELTRKTEELEKLNNNLAQEKRMYEYITQGTETATFDWKIKKDRLQFNKVWGKISGYKAGELKGKGINFWQNLVHPEDIGLVKKKLDEHFKGLKEKFSCEYRFRHKDNSWIWISTKGKVFSRDKNNQPSRMYGMHQDVTYKRKKEIEVVYREKLLEALYSLSPLGIALNDYETGGFIEANQKLVEPTGYTIEEFLHLSYLDLTPPEYKNLDREQISLLDSIGFYGPYEKEYIRKDGSKYPVLLNGVLAYDTNGKRVIWSFIEDISVRKHDEELKEEGRLKNQKLLNTTENQNERLKNFAHIVSHNLRSHSSGISLLLNFLLDSNPNLNADESFMHLKNASSNLETTIKDLNEVVEVNLSGQQNFQGVNLHSVVNKMLESVHALLESENVRVDLDIPEEIEVYGLRSYLESIVLNFITNGIKYSSPVRESFISINARKNTISKKVYIEIIDNGLGINLNLYREKMFKMYKTFHEHKDARGIGLFLTKNQIESMDGTIEVESEVNVGTRFIIKLPYEKN